MKSKKGWLFGLATLLFGVVVASPGPNGAVLRQNLSRAVGNAWNKLQQAGRALSNKLGTGTGSVSRALRRKIRKVMAYLKAIKVTFATILVWPILMVGIAFLPETWGSEKHHITAPLHNLLVVMVVALLVLWFLLLAIGLSIRSIVKGIVTIADQTIGRMHPTAKSIIDDFRTAAVDIFRGVRIFAGIELLISLCLLTVPINKDRELVLILFLGMGIAACFVGISNPLKLLGIAVAIIAIALCCFGGKSEAAGMIKTGTDNAKQWFQGSAAPPANQQAEAQLLPVNQDRLCTDTAGHYLEYHREDPSNTDFYETFPEGCGTFIALPKEYGYNWHVEYAGSRTTHKYIYVREQCAKMMLACPTYHGPHDLLSNRPIPADSIALYIQPAQYGDLRIHFRTDRPPVVPVATTPAPLHQPTEIPRTGRHIYSGAEVDAKPQLLHMVQPEMTDEAVRAHFSGTIPVAVVVEIDGSVDEIHLLKEAGLGLDNNIAKALSQWKFDPGTKDGLPVPVRMIIDVVLPPAPASQPALRGYFFT
jgi:hypothetical protein